MPTTDPKSGIIHTWAYGEDNWNTGMDTNLKRLSRAGTHLAVLDKDLGTPPVSPSDGDAYIVKAAASGAWAGQDGKIAYYDGTAWQFYAPVEGWYADVADEDSLYRYDGSAWAEYAAGGGGGGGGFTTGTWTPVLTPAGGAFTSITYESIDGSYARSGSLVIAACYFGIEAITVGTANGNISITGLPFAVNSDPAFGSHAAGYVFGWTDKPVYMSATGSEVRPYDSLGNQLEVGDISTAGFDNYLGFTVQYLTDAA